MSKFSLDVLNQCVYPYVKTDDPDVIMAATFGEDVALTKVSSDILASHLDPIVGAVKNIGWLAVHVACNDIATSGAPPRWIQLLVLVPHKKDEALLTHIMRDVAKAAEEVGVSIIGGHTGYSANLSRPLVAVTALGTLGDQPPVLTRGAQPGDLILVTKGVALEGTAILAYDFAGTARALGLGETELTEAKQLMSQVSVIPEALLLARHGASAMHDVTRGGLLETLLEMAELSEVGFLVDYNSISMPPVAERFAKVFQFDPLRMISSGTLVASIPPKQLGAASSALDQAGIRYSVIGEVLAGKGVVVSRGKEETCYLTVQPEEDELARMWVVYAPDKNT
ncbi:MAG: AIR synthase family protein [Chloroflexota bacterium]|nr:AIR synthase family protein [Chloroflexota bacterium]